MNVSVINHSTASDTSYFVEFRDIFAFNEHLLPLDKLTATLSPAWTGSEPENAINRQSSALIYNPDVTAASSTAQATYRNCYYNEDGS